MFAALLREGSWCDPRIDVALPTRTPPRAEVEDVACNRVQQFRTRGVAGGTEGVECGAGQAAGVIYLLDADSVEFFAELLLQAGIEGALCGALPAHGHAANECFAGNGHSWFTFL
jgi:hypothetical protein